jgi:hypothetical protein
LARREFPVLGEAERQQLFLLAGVSRTCSATGAASCKHGGVLSTRARHGRTARLRLKLHLHYNGETDTAASSQGAARQGVYVLSATERKQVMQAHMTLVRFWAALKQFVDSGGQKGLKTKGFLARLSSGK